MRRGYRRAINMTALVACILIAVLSAASAAPEPSLERLYEPGLTIKPPKADVVLGETQSIELTVLTPTDIAPALATSAGRIGSAKRVSSGEFTATLTLPATKFPQYAIVSAVDESRQFGWVAVPLKARAKVEVDSEPQVSVAVRLRDAEYGPVLTDSKGRAKIEVLVPPGLSHALSVATDSLGNTSFKKIALGAPPSNRLLAFCPEDSEHMLVFLAERDGKGAAKAGFDVGSEEVSVGKPTRIRRGVFLIPFEVPEGVAAGAEARFRVSRKNSSSTCRLRVPLEEPTSLQLTADKEQVTADESTVVTLTLEWTFPGVRATRRVEPKIEVTHGSITLQDLTNREQRVLWTIPKYFEAKPEAKLDASYLGSGALTASWSVKLLPGRLSKISIDMDGDPLLANGKSETVLRVVPTDAHGNRQRLTEPRASLSGALTRLVLGDDGSYRATYTAMESYTAVADSVTVSDGSGVSGRISVPLTPRQRPFWLTARIGYIDNLGQVRAPVGSLGGGVRVPLANERFVAGAEAGLFQSRSTSADDSGESVEVVLTGLPLLARVAYEVPLPAVLPGLKVYPALSAGVLWAGATASGTSVDQQDSSVVPLYGALVGADFPLGPGRPSLEFGFFSGVLDRDWISGNAAGLQGTVGYSFAP